MNVFFCFKTDKIARFMRCYEKGKSRLGSPMAPETNSICHSKICGVLFCKILKFQFNTNGRILCACTKDNILCYGVSGPMKWNMSSHGWVMDETMYLKSTKETTTENDYCKLVSWLIVNSFENLHIWNSPHWYTSMLLSVKSQNMLSTITQKTEYGYSNGHFRTINRRFYGIERAVTF